MKSSIKTKITLITLAILLIAIGLSTLTSSFTLSRELVKVLQSNANIIGQNLIIQLDKLLKLGIPLTDILGFEKSCQEMVNKYKDISYAMVISKDGKIIFHNVPLKMGDSLKDSPTFNAIKQEQDAVYTTSHEGQIYYEILTPVFDKDTNFVGAVAVGFPQFIIIKKITASIIGTVIITVILLIVAVFLLIIALSRWVSKPLNALITVIKDISDNKLFDKRVKIYSNDEIGHLGNAFNKMTEELQNTTVSKVYVDSIIQNMIDSLIILDLGGKIKSINNAAHELLKYNREDLIGKPNRIIFANKEDSIEGNKFNTLIQNGKIANFETYLKDKHANIIPVLSSLALLKDENNKLTDIIFVATDITDRKRAEEDLKKTLLELREARDSLWGEMQLAKKIQTALLPDRPNIMGFDIAANMTPADSVGGDYYDVINVDDYYWLVIGDVSGHGVSAGLIMMMAQTAIHTVLHQNGDISPKDLLTVINKTLTYNIQKLGDSNYMTITVIACVEQSNFHFSGMHLPLLVYRSKTNSVEMIDTQGMWLGMIPDVSEINKVDSFKLNHNDTLLLYTDGIIEAKDPNDQLFSLERLIKCFKESASNPVEKIKDLILAELKNFSTDDDVSILVMKRK